ncbi:MAG: hypothetical protein Q8M07_11455, partial [Prosthecobacter sp.]|nr:hypothetical protein [Prosthecobacter sp.]
IYGNFFWHNPRESLLQASGRVSIHNNVFADCPSHAAITLRNHDLPVKLVHIYNNTICSAARGIRIASAASEDHAVMGNVVFAGEPLSLHSTITNVRDNITGPVADAVLHLVNPQMTLGTLALHPKPGSCEGTPLDLSPFATETAFDLDFNGTSKGERRIRGAYAAKAGWMLQSGIKPPPAPRPKF